MITHFPHDHFIYPSSLPEVYLEKEILLKDPNTFINLSQWKRARVLYTELTGLLDIDKKSIF